MLQHKVVFLHHGEITHSVWCNVPLFACLPHIGIHLRPQEANVGLTGNHYLYKLVQRSVRDLQRDIFGLQIEATHFLSLWHHQVFHTFQHELSVCIHSHQESPAAEKAHNQRAQGFFLDKRLHHGNNWVRFKQENKEQYRIRKNIMHGSVTLGSQNGSISVIHIFWHYHQKDQGQGRWHSQRALDRGS